MMATVIFCYSLIGQDFINRCWCLNLWQNFIKCHCTLDLVCRWIIFIKLIKEVNNLFTIGVGVEAPAVTATMLIPLTILLLALKHLQFDRMVFLQFLQKLVLNGSSYSI